MTDLLAARRAVAMLSRLDDPDVWRILGIPLAQDLARMEAEMLTSDAEPRLSEGLRYQAHNIDGCIRSYQLLKAMAG